MPDACRLACGLFVMLLLIFMSFCHDDMLTTCDLVRASYLEAFVATVQQVVELYRAVDVSLPVTKWFGRSWATDNSVPQLSLWFQSQ